MPRHRGVYDPGNPEPFELSRSKLEMYIRCPGCFWLEKAQGVKFPSTPPFNINSNTDRLLKRDFDRYRGHGPHPFMVHHGLENLRPFEHPNLERWMSSLHFGSGDDYFSVLHEPTNIRFGGGIDDIWEHTGTGELHVVDYKSTSNQSNDPSRSPWRGTGRKATSGRWRCTSGFCGARGSKSPTRAISSTSMACMSGWAA
jgi:hypothetical protein